MFAVRLKLVAMGFSDFSQMFEFSFFEDEEQKMTSMSDQSSPYKMMRLSLVTHRDLQVAQYSPTNYLNITIVLEEPMTPKVIMLAATTFARTCYRPVLS